MKQFVIIWLFALLSGSLVNGCAQIGAFCDGPNECCGPSGDQDCEAPPGQATKCCAKIGTFCSDPNQCCGPAGETGCEAPPGQQQKCCGKQDVACYSDNDCCKEEYFVCSLGECVLDTTGDNASPFNVAEWVQHDPVYYVYILTFAVFITFICSVPCAWCYIMDRFHLWPKHMQTYAKVANDYEA